MKGLYTVKAGGDVVARDLAFVDALRRLQAAFERDKASKVTISRA